MTDFPVDHRSLIYCLVGISFVLLVLGGLTAPVIVARIPADYFARTDQAAGNSWSVARIVTRVVRSLLGIVLLVAGIAMLVLPGQGILTVLAALLLLEFPGKRRLELSLIRQPPILKTIQWLRRRAGREPLEIPPRDGGPSED